MKRSIGQQVASFFVFYCIVFFPFPFNLINVQASITEFIFGRLIGFTGHTLFGIPNLNTRIVSDSLSMYILVLLLLLLSVLSVTLLIFVKKWKQHSEKVTGFIYKASCYYLIVILLTYGLSKVFKNQFYIPEPNTLYTPMGYVDKELLFWSSMGTSNTYSFFLGAMELLAAILLVFRRTRLVGVLMSLMIALNVVATNFGFDIQVKLFSLFLLFLSLYLLAPYYERLFRFFFREDKIIDPMPAVKTSKTFLQQFFKWFIVGLLFMEALYPFLTRKSLNDDRASRPFLHGVYEVTQVIAGRDTIPIAASPVKRFFVHRSGQVIFQDRQDFISRTRLKLDDNGSIIHTDETGRQTRIPYTYDRNDSELVFHYHIVDRIYELTGKALDWRKLPALRKGFHWTIDGGW